MNFAKTALLAITVGGFALLTTSPQAFAGDPAVVRYGHETVDGVKVFYREAGNRENPTLVLLHGFPASSHQYRNLMTLLGNQYHLIAPDYPGFGSSDYPAADQYEYSFDNIAKTIDQFLEQRGLAKYSLMIQDYGAPVGFRIATAHPERVQSLIVQNGNAYEEGLNRETWAPIMSYWEGKTAEKEKLIIENVFSLQALKWQYTHGTRNPESILPENWLLDFAALSRPGQHAVQLGLFYDYQNNVKLYPQWQAYLKEHQPPALIVWAKNDAFFPVPGAEGYKRDLEDIDYNLLETGHFALEEDGALIANKIRGFLTKRQIK